MKHYVKKFIKIFAITFALILLAVLIAFGGAVLGYWGNADDLDVENLTLEQSSVIVYNDPVTGEEKELQKLNASENREWVDIHNIPEDLQKAIIAIEDERFMEHKGFDLPRTVKATFVWIGNKIIGKSGVSLGGSTITQQLIKNVTGENDPTPVRKIREISRAVALEKELDKTQILEMYLNCIYLSHGCNGVQTASETYFGKDVSELSLAECASIAGITQNPAMYDPIYNPENNRERQQTVLVKMHELGYITDEEFETALNEELEIRDDADELENEPQTNSYFVDQVIRDVLRDLQEKGYSESLANKMLYSGGMKIYAAYNPEIQDIVEDFYEDADNFMGSGAQSAITIIDVRTGQIVGIAGGIGEKTASLTLNRASQSPRQPGSTIKPISAYAPALENGTITVGSSFEDKAKSYNGWVPRNYDYAYRGGVDVRTALRKSLNTTPVEIIDDMGAQESYNFLTEKFGLTTLVESREIDGKIYTDIGLSQLALGGLTDGATTLEMAAAYASFANGGVYHRPYTYTEVKDKDGNVVVSSDRSGTAIMRESTAYIMTEMLKEVVQSGTGVGAAISNANYTAGKTGTTSENNDRWFIGYTPYYVAAIWYGYDIPKGISFSANPCIPVFRSIMTSAHRTLSDRSRINEQPSTITRVSYCAYTGKRAIGSCPVTTYYCGTDNLPEYCNGNHKGYSLPITEEEKEEDEETETEEEESTETEAEGSESSTSSSGTTSGSETTSESGLGSGDGSESGTDTSPDTGDNVQPGYRE